MSLRDGAEIQVRIREILTRELDKRVEASVELLPVRCRHNHRQPLDTRKTVQGERNPGHNRVTRDVPKQAYPGVFHLAVHQTIGLCMYGAEDPTQWQGTVCEDPIDAQRCVKGDRHPAIFEPLATREILSEEFHKQIQDHEWVQENLPEVFGLLWVLGTEQNSVPPPEPEPVLTVTPESEPFTVTQVRNSLRRPFRRWWQFWRMFE